MNNGHRSAGLLRGYKGMIHDGGHREPFIVRWPEAIKAGSVCDELVCLTDVFATLVEINETSRYEKGGEDSVSMLPFLLGKEHSNKRTSLIHHSGKPVFSLRTSAWKLIHETKGNGREPAEPGGPGQLYDIKEDWVEQRDRWDDEEEIASQMTRTIKELLVGSR